MEENYILAKWLNDNLTKAELADFKASPDFEKYQKIKDYTAQLEVADFNEDSVLENIINQEKSTTKVIPIYKKWTFRVAAVLVIGLGITFLMQNLATEQQYALNGKKTTFLLPDNSQVVLNAGSEIEYKKRNWDDNRNLKLQGEAYFKVAKGKKFEVNTTLGKVAVLGTQFNVKARKNRFDVSCFEGRVKVNYNHNEIVLTRGQNVTFENGKQINTYNNQTKPDWLQNKISFNKENLNSIVDEIQRQYNISISVKTTRSKELFTGKIPNDDLNVALKIIATTYHLVPIKVSTNKIILQEK